MQIPNADNVFSQSMSHVYTLNTHSNMVTMVTGICRIGGLRVFDIPKYMKLHMPPFIFKALPYTGRISTTAARVTYE